MCVPYETLKYAANDHKWIERNQPTLISNCIPGNFLSLLMFVALVDLWKKISFKEQGMANEKKCHRRRDDDDYYYWVLLLQMLDNHVSKILYGEEFCEKCEKNLLIIFSQKNLKCRKWQKIVGSNPNIKKLFTLLRFALFATFYSLNIN